MRLLITGGAGFVGSNVAAVAADRGHDVICTVRTEPPPRPDPRLTYRSVNLLDAEAGVRNYATHDRMPSCTPPS